MIGDESRNCLACGKLLKGRIDKKYCDDYCRNHYNNHLKSRGNHNGYIRSVTNALLKNRKILETILPNGDASAKANKEKLLNLGFQFKYQTHSYRTKKQRTYHYCFDYGYLPLENDWYLIVKRKEEFYP